MPSCFEPKQSGVSPLRTGGGEHQSYCSPEYVQISTAAAMTLGYMPRRMHRVDCTHCLNILVTYPQGCRANCSYCGLARHREESRDYAQRNFIRVSWPTVRFQELLDRVKAGKDQGDFQRMCISMITHPDSDADSMDLLRQWREQLPHIPVSILSNPTTLSRADVQAFKDSGADIFTVALDAASEAIFENTRGKTVDSPHRWQHYWQCVHWAAEIFGAEKFGVHLICGMGETELEILQIVQRIRDLGGHSHMFAFFPEAGSMMHDWPAVDAGQWHRVQLARFLIDYAGVRVEQMLFNDDGRLLDFAMEGKPLREIIRTGKPFQTSGCPGKGDPEVSACNRPYGDSGPGDIRSFPFALNDADIERICSLLGTSEQVWRTSG